MQRMLHKRCCANDAKSCKFFRINEIKALSGFGSAPTPPETMKLKGVKLSQSLRRFLPEGSQRKVSDVFRVAFCGLMDVIQISTVGAGGWYPRVQGCEAHRCSAVMGRGGWSQAYPEINSEVCH